MGQKMTSSCFADDEMICYQPGERVCPHGHMAVAVAGVQPGLTVLRLMSWCQNCFSFGWCHWQLNNCFGSV